MFFEIGESGLFRIVGDFVGDADGCRFIARNAAAGQKKIQRTHRTDQFRQQTGGGRREHAELHFRLPEYGVGGDKDEMTGKRNLQAPWLGLTAFFTMSIMLSLLIFIGEAVRDAFDPRKTFR